MQKLSFLSFAILLLCSVHTNGAFFGRVSDALCKLSRVAYKVEVIPMLIGLKTSVDMVIETLEATEQQELAASLVSELLETIKSALPKGSDMTVDSVVVFVTDGHYLNDIQKQFGCSAPSLNIEVSAQTIDALLKLVNLLIGIKDVESLQESINQAIEALLRYIQRQLDSIVAAIGNVVHYNNSDFTMMKRLTALQNYGEELNSSVIAMSIPLKRIFFTRLDLEPPKSAEFLDNYLRMFARVLSEAKSRLVVYIVFNGTEFEQEVEVTLSRLQNILQVPLDRIRKVIPYEETTEFSAEILGELGTSLKTIATKKPKEDNFIEESKKVIAKSTDFIAEKAGKVADSFAKFKFWG